MFDERKHDQKLNIDTRGIVEWPLGVNIEYFRTESTLYSDLDRFIDQYDLLENAKLVDYGSGKGRILYYLNYRFHIPTTGIELSEVAYHQLVNNYSSYSEKYPGLARKISIYKMKAEDYEIPNSSEELIENLRLDYSGTKFSKDKGFVVIEYKNPSLNVEHPFNR